MAEENRTALILPAGGSGKRMGAGIPKQFLKIGGKTILGRTLLAFLADPAIDSVVIACPAGMEKECGRIVREETGSGPPRIRIVPGGAERQDSVAAALCVLADEGFPDDGIVLVHDAVRPFVPRSLTDRVIRAASASGAAVPALPVRETVRHRTRGTIPRDELFSVQTPQGFRFRILREAFRKAAEDGFLGTDEAGLVERIGILPALTEGSRDNIKITVPEDLEREMRIGTGYDVHRLTEGRRLILGGVEIPFGKGLLGHSDADVLTHALCDALFGAASLGDIGVHFPDSDPAYEGASSIELLRRTTNLLAEAGFRPGNADITVICEKPKIRPYIPAMRKCLAEAMGISVDRVSVKGTTTEGLGFPGRGEGIAAQAVCTVERDPLACAGASEKK